MIRYKKFKDYDAYVEKQGGKITFKLDELKASSPKRIRKFTQIFTDMKWTLNKGKILCLGARTGCEVQAARNVGFANSLGVDLHPVGDLVVKGDWHDLYFPDSSYENVFCNSIDHCVDWVKMVDEVHRVLKKDGKFYFLTMRAQAMNTIGPEWTIETRMASKPYDAMFWDTESDLTEVLLKDDLFSRIKIVMDDKYYHAVYQARK